jgi:hypothetical protein
MATVFSQSVRDAAYERSGGRCECQRARHRHPAGRCGANLAVAGWEAHPIRSDAPGGLDTLANCEALCLPCHQNT